MPKIIDYEQFPFANRKGFVPLVSGNGARAYYRIGYLACARDCAEALREQTGRNSSAMPVLYLCRHYIEMSLKDILAAAGAFAIEVSDKKFGHDLMALWNQVSIVLKSFNRQIPSLAMAMLEEISHLDRRSDAFRYAVDRKDAEHFEKIGSVNLQILIMQFNILATFFERFLLHLERQEEEMDEAIETAIARDPY